MVDRMEERAGGAEAVAGEPPARGAPSQRPAARGSTTPYRSSAPKVRVRVRDLGLGLGIPNPNPNPALTLTLTLNLNPFLTLNLTLAPA